MNIQGDFEWKDIAGLAECGFRVVRHPDYEAALRYARSLLPFAFQPHLSSWARQGRRLAMQEILLPQRQHLIIPEAQIIRLDPRLLAFLEEARARDQRIVFVPRVDSGAGCPLADFLLPLSARAA